jgi:hypothetical protein
MNDEQPNTSNEHSTDPWESEMSREFDKRVRDIHEAPLTFENVKGKAMTVRRKGRIAVAGGILAAAAVVVPVAVFAGNGLGDSNDNLDPVAPTVTQATDPNDPTPTETPTGALGVSYLEGTTWHRTDGSSVELNHEYTAGAELDDSLLAVRQDDRARLTIDVVDTDGAVVASLDAYSYPMASPDGTAAAYIARNGQLQIYTSTGDSLSMADGFVDGDSIAAVTGDDCAAGGVNCVVYITHGDGTDAEAIASEGNRSVIEPNVYKLNDVSPDARTAAQTSSSDSGSCSSVIDRGGPQVFETCEYTFDNFSPDAAHLSGTDAYRDGFGQGYVVILDATNGNQVARWNATEGSATNWIWEDESHLLIQAYEQGEWRIYRLGVDGQSEQVLSSTEGDDMTPAFTLLGGS